MCGIIGILGTSPTAQRAIDVLKRLEYRGYDSAGIAVQDDRTHLYKSVGKIKNLEGLYAQGPADGSLAIGHTRWATHGKPTYSNAHPHCQKSVYVVHNGIIENYQDIKDDLISAGFSFQSDTDTEVIATLFAHELANCTDHDLAFRRTIARLEGAYAIAAMIDGVPDKMFGARKGSPLVVGMTEDEWFLCSDTLGLAGMIDHASYLEDGDIVFMNKKGYRITDANGEAKNRAKVPNAIAAAEISKGEYSHFMEKEIHEQPLLLQGVISHYSNHEGTAVDIELGSIDFAAVNQIVIVACGTSAYAAMVAKTWFEEIAHMPARVELASELSSAKPQFIDGTLCVFISQSGETADTLSALKLCQHLGFQTLALVNVPGSSIARTADEFVDILAGPEIGVASTKAFTCQLLVLGLIALRAACDREKLTVNQLATWLSELRDLPSFVQLVLATRQSCREIGQKMSKSPYALFVGRGVMMPVAFEGALKLKEITYIPAEGYAAGELKHGPIALVSEEVPVIGLVSGVSSPSKTESNLNEIASRGGVIYLVHDTATAFRNAALKLQLPRGNTISAAIIFAIPMQMIAYEAAVYKGTDVDQPRNLAKSVTVE